MSVLDGSSTTRLHRVFFVFFFFAQEVTIGIKKKKNPPISGWNPGLEKKGFTCTSTGLHKPWIKKIISQFNFKYKIMYFK